MIPDDSRTLSTSVSVFVYGSTQWEALPLPAPDRVVMHTHCGGITRLAMHLDREGVERMQAALRDALTVLDTAVISEA